MCKSVRFLAALLLLGLTVVAGERPVTTLSPAEAGYEPYLRWTPENLWGRVDWVLVTTEELRPAFEPLLRHRRDLGLAAEVVTVEEIRRDTLLGGGDFPERLRNFVRYAHENYGLRYLLLGGDSEVVPPRMVPLGVSGDKVHHGEPFAAEAYFGCLEGDWNADADSLIGEAEPADDDAPDLTPSVYVGRVPAESTREVEAWVRKALLFERPVHLDYQDRIIYLGGKVFTEDDADQHYRRQFEQLFKDRGLKATFLTKKGEGASTADVMAALTAGAGIVSHYHHSFSYNLSLPSGAIDTGNYAEIKNAERPFFFFSNGCYSNQFTKEGISEKLLLSPDGGPAAFIGSTNTCFSTSLGLEWAFWEHLLGDRDGTIGEALAGMRAEVRQTVGPVGFLRLSLNLLGDPAATLFLGRPARIDFAVKAKDGAITVTRKGKAPGRLRAALVQDGRFAAPPRVLEFEGDSVVFLPAVGNGTPYRITVFGEAVVPVTKEARDPVPVRLTSAVARDGKVVLGLAGAEEESIEVPIPADPVTGVFRVKREVGGAALRLGIPVLFGGDLGFVTDGREVRVPGFGRMAAPRENGIPILAAGDPRLFPPGEAGPPPEGVEALTTESTIRLTWGGDPGARWLVHGIGESGPFLLTPVPLRNPLFEQTGLPPLSTERFLISRAGGEKQTEFVATTTFPFQRGFPQRIGSNTTSVQVLDLDGRRGLEVLFGDDKLGLWALHDDGREVLHAGDNWTFGLFAAVESGVFEPVVADIGGSKRPEILVTSKLKDRKLYAFDRKGKLLKGFPVSFRSRLMTPPLVGDFDGKRGVEILVVSGFGKTIELVYPDGRKKPFAEIGQYNYGYPIAVNLDRDRALEVVLLDGDGKIRAFDQGGKEMKGFPVDLGGPGRCTPMVADLDGKRGLEIVAVGRGTTRVAVVDTKGKVLADLDIPGAGQPSNYSLFYPGLAVLTPGGRPSIMVGTPSKKLFALDLKKGKLEIRKGYPIDLPAEARGVAAVDVDGDGADELFLSLHNGEIWGLTAGGEQLQGFPLVTRADTYAVPLLQDLDGDGDLELFLGAADGLLRVYDLPYRIGKRTPTWCGLLNGTGMPGRPGKIKR